MSELTGKIIFYSVLSSGGILFFAGFVWSLGLGIFKSKRSSGNRNVFRDTYKIRGTVKDTLGEIEKNIKVLYDHEQIETAQGNKSIIFTTGEKQSFFRSLKNPFERIVFDLDELPGNIIHITYSVTLKCFRRNITLTTALILLLITLPALYLISSAIITNVFPAFAMQGDLTLENIRTRRHALQIVHIIHFIWPPYVLLFLYGNTIRKIQEEYSRFLENIQYID